MNEKTNIRQLILNLNGIKNQFDKFMKIGRMMLKKTYEEFPKIMEDWEKDYREGGEAQPYQPFSFEMTNSEELVFKYLEVEYIIKVQPPIAKTDQENKVYGRINTYLKIENKENEILNDMVIEYDSAGHICNCINNEPNNLLLKYLYEFQKYIIIKNNNLETTSIQF